uniref:Uncharacterized protein n=1 Tax=Anopheles epiroticus TaxID=199890 RepID=A0A182PBM1_9DIPT
MASGGGCIGSRPGTAALDAALLEHGTRMELIQQQQQLHRLEIMEDVIKIQAKPSPPASPMKPTTSHRNSPVSLLISPNKPVQHQQQQSVVASKDISGTVLFPQQCPQIKQEPEIVAVDAVDEVDSIKRERSEMKELLQTHPASVVVPFDPASIVKEEENKREVKLEPMANSSQIPEEKEQQLVATTMTVDSSNVSIKTESSLFPLLPPMEKKQEQEISSSFPQSTIVEQQQSMVTAISTTTSVVSSPVKRSSSPNNHQHHHHSTTNHHSSSKSKKSSASGDHQQHSRSEKKQTTEKPSRKLTREERKMEAIVKAFAKMEQSQQRKQELKEQKGTVPGSKRRSISTSNAGMGGNLSDDGTADGVASVSLSSSCGPFSANTSCDGVNVDHSFGSSPNARSFSSGGSCSGSSSSCSGKRKSGIRSPSKTRSSKKKKSKAVSQHFASSTQQRRKKLAAAAARSRSKSKNNNRVHQQQQQQENDDPYQPQSSSGVDSEAYGGGHYDKAAELLLTFSQSATSSSGAAQLMGVTSANIGSDSGTGMAVGPPLGGGSLPMLSSACMLIEAAVGPLEKASAMLLTGRPLNLPSSVMVSSPAPSPPVMGPVLLEPSGAVEQQDFKYPAKAKTKKSMSREWLSGHQLQEQGDSGYATTPSEDRQNNTASEVTSALSQHRQPLHLKTNFDDTSGTAEGGNIMIAAKKVEEFIMQNSPQPDDGSAATNSTTSSSSLVSVTPSAQQSTINKWPTIASASGDASTISVSSEKMESAAVKKRWLRQAISEETDEHPSAGGHGVGGLHSSSSSSSSPPPPNGFTTPLKKRRVIRENPIAAESSMQGVSSDAQQQQQMQQPMFAPSNPSTLSNYPDSTNLVANANSAPNSATRFWDHSISPEKQAMDLSSHRAPPPQNNGGPVKMLTPLHFADPGPMPTTSSTTPPIPVAPPLPPVAAAAAQVVLATPQQPSPTITVHPELQHGEAVSVVPLPQPPPPSHHLHHHHPYPLLQQIHHQPHHSLPLAMATQMLYEAANTIVMEEPSVATVEQPLPPASSPPQAATTESTEAEREQEYSTVPATAEPSIYSTESPSGVMEEQIVEQQVVMDVVEQEVLVEQEVMVEQEELIEQEEQVIEQMEKEEVVKPEGAEIVHAEAQVVAQEETEVVVQEEEVVEQEIIVEQQPDTTSTAEDEQGSESKAMVETCEAERRTATPEVCDSEMETAVSAIESKDGTPSKGSQKYIAEDDDEMAALVEEIVQESFEPKRKEAAAATAVVDTLHELQNDDEVEKNASVPKSSAKPQIVQDSVAAQKRSKNAVSGSRKREEDQETDGDEISYCDTEEELNTASKEKHDASGGLESLSSTFDEIVETIVEERLAAMNDDCPPDVVDGGEHPSDDGAEEESVLVYVQEEEEESNTPKVQIEDENSEDALMREVEEEMMEMMSETSTLRQVLPRNSNEDEEERDLRFIAEEEDDVVKPDVAATKVAKSETASTEWPAPVASSSPQKIAANGTKEESLKATPVRTAAASEDNEQSELADLQKVIASFHSENIMNLISRNRSKSKKGGSSSVSPPNAVRSAGAEGTSVKKQVKLNFDLCVKDDSVNVTLQKSHSEGAEAMVGSEGIASNTTEATPLPTSSSSSTVGVVLPSMLLPPSSVSVLASSTALPTSSLMTTSATSGGIGSSLHTIKTIPTVTSSTVGGVVVPSVTTFGSEPIRSFSTLRPDPPMSGGHLSTFGGFHLRLGSSAGTPLGVNAGTGAAGGIYQYRSEVSNLLERTAMLAPLHRPTSFSTLGSLTAPLAGGGSVKSSLLLGATESLSTLGSATATSMGVGSAITPTGLTPTGGSPAVGTYPKIFTKTASSDPRLNPALVAVSTGADTSSSTGASTSSTPITPKRKLSITEYRKRKQQSSTDGNASSTISGATPTTTTGLGSAATTPSPTSTLLSASAISSKVGRRDDPSFLGGTSATVSSAISSNDVSSSISRELNMELDLDIPEESKSGDSSNSSSSSSSIVGRVRGTVTGISNGTLGKLIGKDTGGVGVPPAAADHTATNHHLHLHHNHYEALSSTEEITTTFSATPTLAELCSEGGMSAERLKSLKYFP